VDHTANRVRKVFRPSPVQGHFGNRVLAFQRLAAGFEIDVLGEALQIIRAPLCQGPCALCDLQPGGLDSRAVNVGKADDCPSHQGSAPQTSRRTAECPSLRQASSRRAGGARLPAIDAPEEPRCEHGASAAHAAKAATKSVQPVEVIDNAPMATALLHPQLPRFQPARGTGGDRSCPSEASSH